MSNKKNIDRLFQEKLKDFEAEPSNIVWENIHQTMHSKRKKRRVVPIWLQLGGAAAILILMLTVGGVFNSDEKPNLDVDTTVVGNDNLNSEKGNNLNSNRNSSQEKSLIESESSNNEDIQLVNGPNTSSDVEGKSNSASTYNNTKIANTDDLAPKKNKGFLKTLPKPSNNSDAVVSANTKTNSSEKTSNATNSIKANNKNESTVKNEEELKKLIKDLSKDNTAVAVASESDGNTNKKAASKSNESSDAKKTTVLEKIEDQIQDNALENAIAQAEDVLTDEKEKELKNRWSVSPNVAPVYFNTLGEGSSIHSQFNSNSKAGELNFSYGIAGAYKINDRLKVRSGVNRVNLGYSTRGVIAYSSPEASNIASVNSPPSGGNIDNINFNASSANNSYISTSAITANRTSEIINTSAKSSLEQQFGFIEVPVELEYKIMDKKLDINVIGGFSTMFLNENVIYDVSQGNRTAIGEANNLNDVSYSANFGIGVNYGVSEKLNINLEPMFKYQINTFDNTSGDFQPYFIGVYTGLSFKF